MQNNMNMAYVCIQFRDKLHDSVCHKINTVRRHLQKVQKFCINAPQCFAKWYTLRRVQLCWKQNASNFLYGQTELPQLVLYSHCQGCNPTSSPARFPDTLHDRSRVSLEQYVETGLAERCIRIHENTPMGERKFA
jgi:hypothetical protein